MAWWLDILIIFLVILFSMMLHELAHGLMAYWLGDDTAKQEGRLTLNPFKHLDPFMSFALPLLLFISGGPIFGGAKPVPIDTRNLKHGVWGMALVAVAGPLTNFIIAFMAFSIAYFSGAIVFQSGLIYSAVPIWSDILMQLVAVNLGFGVFNLIPIPPLDGSRVLYAIAPDGVRRFMEGMERWGIIVVLLVVVFGSGLITNFMGGAIEAIITGFSWLLGVR